MKALLTGEITMLRDDVGALLHVPVVLELRPEDLARVLGKEKDGALEVILQ